MPMDSNFRPPRPPGPTIEQRKAALLDAIVCECFYFSDGEWKVGIHGDSNVAESLPVEYAADLQRLYPANTWKPRR